MLVQATIALQKCKKCLPPDSGDIVDICLKCCSSFKKEKLPKACSVNNIDIGCEYCYPGELDSLSSIEERLALELRGMRVTNVGGQMVPSQCDPYSLYVQLSRCPSLDGIMLVSKVRERDLVGNTVPEDMTAAEARLGELSRKTIDEAAGLAG